MTLKKKAAAVSAVVLALLLGGCSLFGTTTRSAVLDYDFSDMELVQLKEPEEGRLTAVIQTSMGDITAVLYPEYAPKAVSNFVNRANDGYYDNTAIFQNYEKLFVATGSSGNGTSGATDDGELLENEYSPNLWPFKGALCAYSLTQGYCDSRYIICGTYEEFTEQQLSDLKSVTRDGEQLFPDEVIEAWAEYGAIPTLSGFYTVFGQVVDGMDVLEDILNSEYNAETYAPIDDITVYHVEITEYSK
ncbi:MAG: peptidylprolyl isomerase [Bacteroides sp.]|nr:peptidylprolyl isomerase [Bacteroides sp.]